MQTLPLSRRDRAGMSSPWAGTGRSERQDAKRSRICERRTDSIVEEFIQWHKKAAELRDGQARKRLRKDFISFNRPFSKPLQLEEAQGTECGACDRARSNSVYKALRNLNRASCFS